MPHVLKAQVELVGAALGLLVMLYGVIDSGSLYAMLGVVGFALLVLTVKSKIKHMRLAGVR